MPRSKLPRPCPPLSLHRFAATLSGVNVSGIKQDLARLDYLRRTGVQRRWRVRKSTAKHLFEERFWAWTGKMDIFPTEAGKTKLRELHADGQLTLKVGFGSAAQASQDGHDHLIPP